MYGKQSIQNKIERLIETEPSQINNKRTDITMEVSIPMFVIGIKDDNSEIKEEKELVKKHIAIEIILNMLIGKSSNLYKELYEKGDLISEPFIEYEFTKTYAHLAITGQSKDPDKILEKLEKQIQIFKSNGLNKEHFERIKNMIYGSYIKEYNNVSDISRMFVTDYFKGINSFEYLNNFNDVTISFTQDVLNNIFKEDKTVISIVRGNEEKEE